MNLAPAGDGFTFDKERVSIPEACKRLREAGADVVGINCFGGPDTFLPMIRKVKEAVDVSFVFIYDLKEHALLIKVFLRTYFEPHFNNFEIQCPVACIPVPYRTDPEKHPLFFDFKDYKTGMKSFLFRFSTMIAKILLANYCRKGRRHCQAVCWFSKLYCLAFVF